MPDVELLPLLTRISVLLQLAALTAKGHSWRVTKDGKGQLLRVMIAEESEVIVDRLQALIEEEIGATILVTARTASAAASLFPRFRPDVVIIDPQMSDGSGYTVLRKIKKTDPGCVVIVLTNHTSDDYRDVCHALGAEFFLVKSAEFMRVTEILAELCRVGERSAVASRIPQLI